tara:strand:+ start:98525 stop:98707 length:183 start_codon:yes stop_codon:yes gene_type:complete
MLLGIYKASGYTLYLPLALCGKWEDAAAIPARTAERASRKQKNEEPQQNRTPSEAERELL